MTPEEMKRQAEADNARKLAAARRTYRGVVKRHATGQEIPQPEVEAALAAAGYDFEKYVADVSARKEFLSHVALIAELPQLVEERSKLSAEVRQRELDRDRRMAEDAKFFEAAQGRLVSLGNTINQRGNLGDRIAGQCEDPELASRYRQALAALKSREAAAARLRTSIAELMHDAHSARNFASAEIDKDSAEAKARRQALADAEAKLTAAERSLENELAAVTKAAEDVATARTAILDS
jgi:hypothetical protein